MIKQISLAVITAAFITACADPAANKPKAETSVPAVNAAPAEPAKQVSVLAGYQPLGTQFAITVENSKVEFTGSKVTGKHDGGFKGFRGLIDVIDGKPESSKVLVEIATATVFTDADGLTKHLQESDFFDSPKFPRASFVSTEITPAPDKGERVYNVKGELELRGVKRTITFPATIELTPDNVNVNAEFSINRKDFGIVYAGKADDLIRDDVVMRLDLKATKR